MKEELNDKAKEARRKYQREYYRNNKEKRREWNNRYWEKRGLRVKEVECK